MEEGIDLLGAVKMLTPFLKIKNVTHQHSLCVDIVAGVCF